MIVNVSRSPRQTLSLESFGCLVEPGDDSQLQALGTSLKAVWSAAMRN